ncbi:MAG: ribosomal protein S18 acetylase RimI-like enzyme [Halioglobus sp.]|jgi:ribosomal protein S18 acetylase RimI-like enzyme
MKLRAYHEQEQSEVIALWTRCGLVVPQNNPVKDIQRKLQVDRDLFLTGYTPQGIVATVMGGYDGHRGWINYLAVDPSQQRKGYGRIIMSAIEALLKAKGCPKINLQVRSNNSDIIGFYAALGYGNDNVVGLGKRLEHDT